MTDMHRETIERLTRERDAAWKASAQSQEERCIALSNSIGFREQRDKALTVAEAAERKLAIAVEALRKLAKASARLSVAAQTTGGVAGRDEGLCAEIDRLAQPLGEARATLAALEKNDE